jgi:hypothetical protein
MGYYTNYKLTLHLDPNSQYDEIEVYFNDSEHEGEYWHGILDGDRGSMKWYDHDDDMLAISELFPDVVFKLEGEAEESGDLWIKYYKNGKKQTCNAVITFDEFNETKLI